MHKDNRRRLIRTWFPEKSRVKSVDSGDDNSSEKSEHESRKHKKRRHQKRSESQSNDEGSGEEDHSHRRHKRSKRKKNRSETNRKDGEQEENKVGLEGETEEQYDARLEREETERLAAQRKIHLEHMKRAQEDVPTKNGVRFKGMASNSYIPNVVSILNSSIGRGRMKYLDPELRRD